MVSLAEKLAHGIPSTTSWFRLGRSWLLYTKPPEGGFAKELVALLSFLDGLLRGDLLHCGLALLRCRLRYW